jgi:polysaccharide export outer membrane protein
MRYLLTILLTVFMLSACSGEWSSYPAEEAALPSALGHIHTSDVLSVQVFEEPNLTGDYTVDQMGIITMPLIGSVDVLGRDVNSVSQSIEQALKDGGYLVRPDVTVALTQERRILVTGEVLSAGEYMYRDGMTVLDAVAMAGGFSYRANQSSFDIVRKISNGSEKVIKAGLATKIMPNDVIRVRERFF